MLRELRAQIAYHRRLTVEFGHLGATRYRAATFLHARGLQAATFAVRPPNVPYPVHMRIGTSDILVYRQVFQRAEYGALSGVDDVRTVVDCGANIGLTSVYFLNLFPRSRVIAIEPDPSNADLCRRNLAAYGARAKVIEAGVWSRPTKLSLQSKGLGKEWGTQVRASADGATNAIDIPSLGLPTIDILKVDIEGSELEVFGNEAAGWLKSVRNIAIELHTPECERVFRQALDGFQFTEVLSGELVVCSNIRALS